MSERLPQAIALLCVLLSASLCFGAQSPVSRYLSPVELAVSPAGDRLYVVCETAGRLLAIDTATGKVAAIVATGRNPKSVSLSADGRRAWVANSWSDTVSEIDTAAMKVRRTLRAGFEPNSAVADREGRFLYTANRIGSDISVIDLASGREDRRLLAGHGSSYLTLSPDGRRLYGTHIYPNPGVFRTPPESELTVIDTSRQAVVRRERLPSAAGVFHVALSRDGRFGAVAQMRPKNLIPLAHVAHGWVIGNSLTVFGEEVGDAVEVPIDELDRYFTPPFGVAIARDGSALYVSATGSDSVTVIDKPRLTAFLRTLPPERRRALANDLSASANYVRARIAVGRAPKGIALSPDGGRLYVANRLDDTVSVIDTRTRRVAATWTLGGPRELTPERRGERLFFSARFAFQKHFGCANCHIEATVDGLSWDLAPDGFGADIVDNRLLEEVAETAPYKWNGGNPDLESECGPRTEMYFFRSQSFSPPELADIVRYVKSIPRRPNRFRAPNGELTAQQERGKAIFERERTKSGAPIAEENRCYVCHSGPLHTNRGMADVGTGKPTDRSPQFDIPHLINVVLSPPYLHDGSAATLEEIWTVYNPKDTHGHTNDLSKDELNDLIEYLKTL